MLGLIALVVGVLALSIDSVGAYAADACPNAAVRAQQGAGYLPDCRAYELVSPASKLGYSVGGNSDPNVQLSVGADGDQLGYMSVYPFPPSDGGSLAGFHAQRTATGWTTAGLLPVPGPNQLGAAVPGVDAVLRGTTPAGNVAVYFDTTTEPYGSLWIRRADGTRQKIADGSRPPFGQYENFGAASGQPWLQNISSDGRHIVFSDSDALVPGITSTGNDILYEWVDDGGAGTLRVVNRTNDPALQVIDGGPAELGGNGAPDATSGYHGALRVAGLRHAISASGRRLFFQNPASAIDPSFGVALGGGALYLREDGARTTELSAPAPGYVPANAPTLVQYLDASYSAADADVDGRYVFFWANGDLTGGAPAAGGIYRYDNANGSLTFLVPTPAATTGPPSAMASDDGTHVYYQDGGDVRVWSDGDSRLVAANSLVAGGGAASNSGNDYIVSDRLGIVADDCPSANVTADGRYFAFSARPVGSDIGTNDLQVYRYDASEGSLQPVSQAPGVASTPHDSGFSGAGACTAVGFLPREVQTRIMSDDGRFVFFDTAAPLVARDGNQRLDVYRWQADTGRVDLLSSGSSPQISLFANTDGTGHNAFFVTESPLAGQDGDAVFDLYDARVDGGFLQVTPPDCEGEACQGAIASSPAVPVAGSMTFVGAGDVQERARVGSSSVRVTGLKAVTGSVATLKVTVPAAGTISVSGSSVLKATRSASRAASYSLRVSLTAKAKRSLHDKRSLKATVTVAFRPTSGRPASKRLTLTFKQPKPSKKTKKAPAAHRAGTKEGR